ncbi:hypothetical protein LTR27_003380 [Elasticomyces elasticus]|nr:hypothetical protein LTR27_003380 [Elasticomyces elasticus]
MIVMAGTGVQRSLAVTEEEKKSHLRDPGYTLGVIAPLHIGSVAVQHLLEKEEAYDARTKDPELQGSNWFQQSSAFQDWRRDGSELLWMSGKLGSGKSTLMTQLQELQGACNYGASLGEMYGLNYYLDPGPNLGMWIDDNEDRLPMQDLVSNTVQYDVPRTYGRERSRSRSPSQKTKVSRHQANCCSMNVREFSHPFDLRRHVDRDHYGTVYSCPRLASSFSDPEELYRHVKVHGTVLQHQDPTLLDQAPLDTFEPLAMQKAKEYVTFRHPSMREYLFSSLPKTPVLGTALSRASNYFRVSQSTQLYIDGGLGWSTVQRRPTEWGDVFAEEPRLFISLGTGKADSTAESRSKTLRSSTEPREIRALAIRGNAVPRIESVRPMMSWDPRRWTPRWKKLMKRGGLLRRLWQGTTLMHLVRPVVAGDYMPHGLSANYQSLLTLDQGWLIEDNPDTGFRFMGLLSALLLELFAAFQLRPVDKYKGKALALSIPISIFAGIVCTNSVREAILVGWLIMNATLFVSGAIHSTRNMMQSRALGGVQRLEEKLTRPDMPKVSAQAQ